MIRWRRIVTTDYDPIPIIDGELSLFTFFVVSQAHAGLTKKFVHHSDNMLSICSELLVSRYNINYTFSVQINCQ